MREPRRSPWAVVGVGCVGLLVAALVVFAAFVFVGERMARSVRRQAVDPDARRTAVLESLGASRLPEGYRPALAVTVPLLGQVVVLEGPADSATVAEALALRPQFLCLAGKRGGASRGSWVDDVQIMLDVRGLTLRPGATLLTGRIPLDGTDAPFRAVRAELDGAPASPAPVVATWIDVRCPGPEAIPRTCVWIVPDPAADGPGTPDDLAGSPADPHALDEFLARFDLCRP